MKPLFFLLLLLLKIDLLIFETRRWIKEAPKYVY